MADQLRSTFWFVVPFGITLLIASVFVMRRGDQGGTEVGGSKTDQPGSAQLMGRAIAASALIEAQSRAPITEQGITVPDTAVVILLGAIGCSMNQIKVLQL